MIGETNINGGAGLNGEGALLKINAETGSTITVSKEGYSKVIKTSQLDPDDNNRSYWFFQTKDFGEWTVTATKGGKIKSDTVLITSEGQIENVALNYQLVLFDGENGGDNTAVTGGWDSSATDSGNRSEITSTYLLARNGGDEGVGNWYGGTSNVYTKKGINVLGYNTCTFTVTQANNSPKFYVGGAVKTVSSSGTYTLDISSVTGEVTVKMEVSRPSETWNRYSFKVTKIILA